MEIADPAVVWVLNPDPYTRRSVFTAEVTEISGAGKAVAFAAQD